MTAPPPPRPPAPSGDLLPGGRVACWACGNPVGVAGVAPLNQVICPTCGEKVLSPLQLDQFLLTRFLGQGAMGRVYLARDLTLNRDVAVKILRNAFLSSPRMWSQLEKEAKNAALVRSNRVVQIYRLGRIENRPYIVMELVNHPTLEALMQRRKIELPELRRIALDVMEALAAAQAAGMVHGDVKPANILVDLRGRAKVADFGLARFVQHDQPVERWGTPYYMAPEKIRREREDFRSDLYSLGASLFHVLTGQAPFEGTTGEEVMEAAQKSPMPEIRSFRPDLPEDFAKVVTRMMHRDPDKRFQSYAEAVEALEATERAETPEPRPPESASPLWSRLHRFLFESPAEKSAKDAQRSVRRA